MNIKIIHNTFIYRCLCKNLLLIPLLFFGNYLLGQSTTVLPGNASFSQTSSPQGGLRYQRGFYLMTPKEVKQSGLTNGMPINSIGFTIGKAQDSTTKGAFKVYLQNTTDAVARLDTDWTNVSVSGLSHTIPNGLYAGNYEWQVRTVCASNSPYSLSIFFSNDNLGSCSNPTNLSTTAISINSATFNWDAPASIVTNYIVEYKSSDASIWTQATSSSNFYNATGLAANKNYQWRVKTVCSASSSDFVSNSFLTLSAISCTAPVGLSVSAITDVQANVSWGAVTGASYYNVQYRRVGTTTWIPSTSFTNSLLIKSNLVAGTSYEWQVRTVCAAGSGAYVSGANFTTTGTVVCYSPLNLSTNAITDTSVVFKWNAVAGSTSYELRYRLKESISWIKAITPTSPMTLVHNDSLKVPNKIGQYNVLFVGGSSFNYTGEGVYVAWEYSQSAKPLSKNNVTLSTTAYTCLKNVSGVDSVKYLLSFIAKSDTSLVGQQSRLLGTNLRPETRLGSSSLSDSVAVVSVYTLGKTIPNYQSPTTVSALIANKTNSAKTYTVTLRVKSQKSGIIRHTNSQNLVVAANDSSLITFSSWLPSIIENDTILVSIPTQSGENVINNNTAVYFQEVNKSILGYADASSTLGSAGFDLGSGLLLNKHNLKGCGKVIAAKVFLTESAKNHPVYAVVRNLAGVIVAQSPEFTPDSANVNTYHSFYFTSPALFTNEEFFIGLAQKPSLISYRPVGTQYEIETRADSYFAAHLDGTSLVDSSELGRLMIHAEIVTSAPEPFITGNLILCGSSSTTLNTISTNTRYANSVIDFSSQNSTNGFSASQALGSPNAYPTYGVSSNSWVSSTADGQQEFLTLGFAEASTINYVDVYEVSNSGAVEAVYVKNPSTSNFELVYSTTAEAKPNLARKNHITFSETAFNVSEVKIVLNSVAIKGYNAIDAVGIGKSSTAAFSSYLWSPGGETSATKTVNIPGKYTMTTTNSTGCISVDSVTVSAASTTLPIISHLKPLAFCLGDSVVLTSSQLTGNLWSTGETTSSIIVKTAGTYTVSYNTGGGCGSLTSLPVIVSVNSLPTVSISGNLSICPSSSVILDAGSGYTTYLWTNGFNTQTINASYAGTFGVKVTNSYGCSVSANVTTLMATVPTPIITGTLQICPGNSTTLDAGAGFSSYLWSNGANSQSISVNSTGTFTVTVTNSSGCTGIASVSTILLTPPVPTISGNSAFCPGGSISISANSGYSSYLWSNGANTAGTSINTAGAYFVTVTGSNGCTGIASKVISQAIPPAPVISGTLSFCGSSSTALNAGSGFTAYLWSTGATSQSILVSTASTFTVTVTNSNGCTGTASATTTKTGSVPATPGQISGNTGGVCNSIGNVYTIDAISNASFYVWKVPTGSTITSGQGTTSILVNFSAGYTSGIISVAASNACGQSPTRNARILNVIGAAATPTAIAGQQTALCGLSGKTYSITPINGATSYSWTVPAGVTIASGQGTASISVNFASNFGAGNICVKAISPCGNSADKCISVSGTTYTPGLITGLASTCSKTKNVAYSIASVSGATSYTWAVPDQATIVSGQGTTNIVVSFGTKSGSITVLANNACGSSGVQTLEVTFANCRVASDDAADINQEKGDKINIYPNPASGTVNIDFGNAEKGNYQVIISNIIGQQVYNQKHSFEGNLLKADLSHLQKGFYTMAIIGEKRKNVLKLIMQ
jgi:PKD-like domain/Secretion system C-terminal sorting domain/Fibronectin type III domain